MKTDKLLKNSNDQHNALMDEFKKAHKRMFKNGFAESDDKQIEKDKSPLKVSLSSLIITSCSR